jgi:hypothetical protein
MDHQNEKIEENRLHDTELGVVEDLELKKKT